MPRKKPAKQKILIGVVPSIDVFLDLPARLGSNEEKIHDYLWDRYHIDWDYDPDSDYWDSLFFNNDLRSIMGMMIDSSELHMQINPLHFVDVHHPITTSWNTYFLRLMKDAKKLIPAHPYRIAEVG